MQLVLVLLCFQDLWTRIGKATEVTKSMEKNITNDTTIFNTVLYGCETWTYNKKITDKLLAFELNCYQRILRISWIERKTNREMCGKTQN